MFFFVIPVIYFALFENDTKENFVKQPDYLFYSVKTSKPAFISLFAGKDSVSSWNIASEGYKMIDCVCNMNDSAGLTLKINNLSASDTASFLAFNFFRNHILYSLYDRSYPYCSVENATTMNRNGVFSIVPNQPNKPVILRLAKTLSWQKMHPIERKGVLVCFVFLIAFIVIVVMAPPPRYLIVSCLATLLLLFLFSWLGKDVQDQVTMSTSTPQRSVETYYSHTPLFHSKDKFPSKIYKYFFRTQVEIGDHQYIRCDVDDSLRQLNDYSITVKSGLLSKQWQLAKVPLGKMALNDLRFDKGTFVITGNDPFVALTTTFFVDPIHKIVDIRTNAFLFICLFIFVLLIFFHKRIGGFDPYSVFLVAIFLSLIFGGLLFKPFNADRVRLIAEKRDAETLPQFSSDSLKTYSEKLSFYLNDQVMGRNKIIPFNNYIYYSIFGQLLDNPNVYFGDDGWMFYIGANGRETYENRTPISNEQLYKIKCMFEDRHDWLKERGIKLYIIFPRISQFIYEEKIGSRMFRYNKTSKLEQLVTYLKQNSDLEIIDVAKPLLDAKDPTKPELYYKKATHWNYYGAYFAYAAIINRIRQDFPEVGPPIALQEISWNQYEEPKQDMDLIQMSALIGYVTGHEIKPRHSLLYAGDTVEQNSYTYKPDFPTLYVVNKSKERPNMVMFRDSYAIYLYPYLGHHFCRSAYFWTPTFNKTLVSEEKPDILIWEINERFIPNYILRNNPSPFRFDLAYKNSNDSNNFISSVTKQAYW